MTLKHLGQVETGGSSASGSGEANSEKLRTSCGVTAETVHVSQPG